MMNDQTSEGRTWKWTFQVRRQVIVKCTYTNEKKNWTCDTNNSAWIDCVESVNLLFRFFLWDSRQAMQFLSSSFFFSAFYLLKSLLFFYTFVMFCLQTPDALSLPNSYTEKCSILCLPIICIKIAASANWWRFAYTIIKYSK